MKFIEKVEEVFEVSGVGCIIAPGIPYGFKPSLKIGAKIQFKNKNGSIINTTINSFQFLNRGKEMQHAPFSVDNSIKKEAIEIGAELYLVNEKYNK